jgi:membrane dipeptidase
LATPTLLTSMRSLAQLVFVSLILGTAPALAQGTPTPSAADMARALRVLRAAPVMDGHNDLPWRIREDSLHPGDVDAYDLRTRTPGMTDLARLRQGHVGAQF